MKNDLSAIRKEIRFLKAYAIISTSVFMLLWFSGSGRPDEKKYFEEIDVERINIVETNGQLRVVLANTDRMPDPVVDGKPFKAERPPGMIFYNGLGDECGGLVFGAVANGDAYGSYGGMTFDQYKQSQAIGIITNDHSGSRTVGLSIWDRPETSIAELMQKRRALEEKPEGPDKEAAQDRLREEQFSPKRVFVGKSPDKAAAVRLYDANGNERIAMVVDAAGTARLDFLDEKGNVVSSYPEKGKVIPGE